MFQEIWLKLKEILNKMLGANTIKQVLDVTPAISTQMENSIKLWTKMYQGEAPWLHNPDDDDPTRVVSLGLPALIASEKARTALLELQSEITTPTEEVEEENPDYTPPQPDEFGNILPPSQSKTIIKDVPTSDTSRAEYLESQYKKLKKQLRRQIEYGIAKGGLVIKPYVVFNEEDAEYPADIDFEFIQADSFYPLSFNINGQITEAAFLETKVDKEYTYRRLEYHKIRGTTVEIINKAFRAVTNKDVKQNSDVISLGEEIPLSEVPEWESLQTRTNIKGMKKPLFAYFKMPEANTIDMTSPLGVSGFSRAVDLIKDADMQYSRLLWEYEGGELAIDIDRDALRTDIDANGVDHTKLNSLQRRLYRKIDVDQTGETYFPYTPSLRDSSYVQGLNTILMRIEDVCGVSRGTLSDAASEARTATELKILKQRSYQTNADIQKAIEDTLKDVIYIMNVYCDLYELTPYGEYDVSFEWDDSIMVDINEELTKRITLMQNGLASKLETRMWYFGETERQAQQALDNIKQESIQNIQENLAVQMNQANIAAQNDREE